MEQVMSEIRINTKEEKDNGTFTSLPDVFFS